MSLTGWIGIISLFLAIWRVDYRIELILTGVFALILATLSAWSEVHKKEKEKKEKKII